MTNTLLAVTLIASVICFQRRDLMDKFIFNPSKISQRNEWYRFITSGFIHADWIHLLINMFVLYSFGQIVESYYRDIFGAAGRNYYLLLYFGGMIASVLPTFFQHKNNPSYNALGASGAISAVVFAFILFNPLEKLYLYGLLRIPGIVFGILYLAYCYYAARKGGDYINHDAHFWGALYGVCFTLAMKPQIGPYFIEQLKGILP
jgi:membrane associated rhomboid family serine protease